MRFFIAVKSGGALRPRPYPKRPARLNRRRISRPRLYSLSYDRDTLSRSRYAHMPIQVYDRGREVFTIFRETDAFRDSYLPYAVSLALRYAYRELRSSKTTYNRKRAKRQLTASCDILRELARTFPAAMLMVELADQTLREMEKVVTTILNTQQQSTKERQIGELAQVGGLQETAHQPVYQNSQQDAAQTAGLLREQQSPGTALPHLDGVTGETNFDVFDYFDSDFNLDAIDATLGDNFELSFPYVLSSPET